MKQQTYSWEQAVKASYRALQDEKKCLIDIGLTSKMFGEVPESSLKRLGGCARKNTRLAKVVSCMDLPKPTG